MRFLLICKWRAEQRNCQKRHDVCLIYQIKDKRKYSQKRGEIWKQKLSRPSGGLFVKQRSATGKRARPGTVPATINKSAVMAGSLPNANTRNGEGAVWSRGAVKLRSPKGIASGTTSKCGGMADSLQSESGSMAARYVRFPAAATSTPPEGFARSTI